MATKKQIEDFATGLVHQCELIMSLEEFSAADMAQAFHRAAHLISSNAADRIYKPEKNNVIPFRARTKRPRRV